MPLLPPPLPHKQPAESSKDLQSVDALLILPNRRILLHTYTDRLKGDAGYSLENRKHSARGPAIDSRTGRPDGKAPPGRPALCSRKKKAVWGRRRSRHGRAYGSGACARATWTAGPPKRFRRMRCRCDGRERERARVAALLAEPQPVPFGEPFKVVTASLSILPA